MATEPTRNPLPEIIDRAKWQAELDSLLAREKAHTREGDAIAAARRRLPMVEVDAQIPLVGPDGPVPLLDVFEGRRQLIAYLHMWHDGKPAADQCEGCTFFTGHALELSYLHTRDVTYATFCEGPYRGERPVPGLHGLGHAVVLGPRLAEGDTGRPRVGRHFCYLRDGDRVFETYWTTGRGVEAGANSYHLLDLTVYGRQELWEDSPEGWPHSIDPSAGDQFRTDGRPTAQWSRLKAGRSDDLYG